VLLEFGKCSLSPREVVLFHSWMDASFVLVQLSYALGQVVQVLVWLTIGVADGTHQPSVADVDTFGKNEGVRGNVLDELFLEVSHDSDVSLAEGAGEEDTIHMQVEHIYGEVGDHFSVDSLQNWVSQDLDSFEEVVEDDPDSVHLTKFEEICSDLVVPSILDTDTFLDVLLHLHSSLFGKVDNSSFDDLVNIFLDVEGLFSLWHNEWLVVTKELSEVSHRTINLLNFSSSSVSKGGEESSGDLEEKNRIFTLENHIRELLEKHNWETTEVGETVSSASSDQFNNTIGSPLGEVGLEGTQVNVQILETAEITLFNLSIIGSDLDSQVVGRSVHTESSRNLLNKLVLMHLVIEYWDFLSFGVLELLSNMGVSGSN